jgi:hypothetical protein
MVWLLEKMVVRHIVNLGLERVTIPVRVKFEFEVRARSVVPDSLSIQTLYNRPAIENRYPHLDADALERSILETVGTAIHAYWNECGFSW